MAANSAPPANDDDDVIDVDEPAVDTNPRRTPVASLFLKPGTQFAKLEAPSVPAASSVAINSATDTVPSSPTVASDSASGAAGTGSAAAPARSPQKLGEGTAPNVVGPGEALFEKRGDVGKGESPAPLAAPSFSFGGANYAEEPSGGGSKKMVIGIAAAAVIAVGLYAGITQFHGKTSSTEESPKSSATTPPTTVTPPANTAAPKVPPANVSSKAAPEVTSPSSSSTAQPTPQPTSHRLTENPVADSNQRTSDKTPAAKAAGSIAAPTAKASSDVKPAVHESAAQPIMVKNGNASPAHRPSTASDAAAPSVLDIAPSTSGGSLSNLLSNPNNTSAPVLQALNISQGVSQGLLIKKAQPVYPPAAIRMRVEGAVQLLATIGKTGNITAVKILSGEPVLAQSALDAVKQWKYKPYYLNGDPVEIQTQVTINFKLPK